MTAKKKVNLGQETERIEFKKSTSELREGVISVCAMLNKHGEGTLYFGVKDNGDVIGQVVGRDTKRDVGRAITDHIKPAIYPTVSEETYDGADVIKVTFQGGRKPYTAYRKPYIRVADEDKQMDQDTYHELLLARDDISLSWENQISDFEVNDVNAAVFRRYMKRAREVGRITLDEQTPAVVMKKLGLTKGKKLLNAGAALFVDSNINDLQLVKYASNERTTITDIRKLQGSILGLIDEATEYLIDAMDWRAEFGDGRGRKEIPEIPVDALREAVVNAFAHRQIESGQSVQIMVFRDRIEIYSPGPFPERVTPELFVKGEENSIRRNKLIAGILYYSKDMETLAMGLKKIHDLCKASGVKYEFKRNIYGFTVIFRRHCGEGWGWMGSEKSGKAKKLPPKSIGKRVTLFSTPSRMIRELPRRSLQKPQTSALTAYVTTFAK